MIQDKKNGTDVILELQDQYNFLGKWASFFIKRHRLIYLIILMLIIWGVTAYNELPREVNPKVVIPYGMVLTTYNGASPEEVEFLVTNKLEKKLDELENVKNMSSSSGLGYSMVFIEFETGVDMDEMIQKVRDKVAAVQPDLPDGADIPEVSDFKTNNTPIMIINLAGEYDFAQLKKTAEKIKDELEKINHVSDVEIIGGLEREIKITVDPQKLAVYNLSLDQISAAISQSNINFPGGNITLDNKQYNIRTVGQYIEAEQLKHVIVSYIDSSPLLLGDIAKVEDGYKDAESYSRMAVELGSDKPGTQKTVALSVKKKEAGDVIKISKDIRNMLESKKGIVYPENLQVEISGDTSVYVQDELGTVINNAQSGLFLVIMVLFLFIGLRESIIVSFVIPLAILSTLGLMNVSGITFNTVSLFSLVLSVGMLVDNGVVIMENIDRLRLMGVDSELAAEAGTNQIAPAVASSTLTTLAAFFPLILTAGIMGDFIRDIPKVVIFALSASLFIALTVTPILSSRLLKQQHSSRKKKEHPYIKKYGKMLSIIIVFILGMYSFKYSNTGAFEFGILSWLFGIVFAVLMYLKLYRSRKDNKHPLIDWYGEKLYWILSSRKRKLVVIGISIILFVSSMLLIPLGILKVEMFGATDSTRLYIDINAPKGTTLESTSVLAEEVEKRLFKYTEIKSFVSNIGAYGADSLNDFSANSGSTPNLARITIDLYEKDYREKTSMQLAEEFREMLKNIPGAEIKVQELVTGPPTGTPIYIRIKGENLEDLKQVAKEYALRLEAIQGTRDIEDGINIGAPELQVRVNKAKAAALGLNDMTIAFGVRNAIYGLTATTFRSNQDEIDVVIRTTKERLKTVEDIRNLYFYSRSGQAVPFSQVAEIVDSESLNAIRHEDMKRLISVSANIDTNITAGEVLEAFKKAVSDYPLPEGVIIEYGGEMEDMEESFTDMFTNMIIAAILVYLILATQFNSLSQPLIILFTVPLALIGVMPGLAITGHKFDFLAFIGVVALVGIAVNNAIVLVDYINYLRKKGYSVIDAVKETGITRFKPVMATTITTIGGILPMTLKQPFFASMGYGLMFGLSVSTLLTLVVIPVLYTIIDRAKEIGSGFLSKKEMNL
ncbi:MAG: hypothetical protein APF77_22325 [Clostridia bacterium BRH_c25]|nr:MAG: hypothetical protein APF77_22325 [Clostridia bacterium BRH_c25]